MTGTPNITAISLHVCIAPKFTDLGAMVVYCNGKALRFEIYWGGRGAEGRLGVEFIMLGGEGNNEKMPSTRALEPNRNCAPILWRNNPEKGSIDLWLESISINRFSQ